MENDQPHPPSHHPQANHPPPSHPPQPTIPPQAGTSSPPNRTNPKTLFFPVIDHGPSPFLKFSSSPPPTTTSPSSVKVTHMMLFDLAPQTGHVPPAPISGSNDLLSLFNVSSMYDWFVKPYLKPLDQPNKLLNSTFPTINLTNPHHHHIPSTNGDLKGKGKADNDLAGPSPAQLELGQKRIKMDKSYGHFVADVGGRNSIKKDHQLENWITDGSFQEANIEDFLKPFSNEVLSQAFNLQPGTLPAFDTSVWVAEEGGPKKRRKKRKQGEMLAGSNPSQVSAHPQQHLSQSHPAAPAFSTPAAPHQHSAPSSTPLQPPRPSRAIDSSSHLSTHPPHQHQHLPAHAAHLHLPQQTQQQHSASSMFCREDDYRKKKRVKIGNASAGKNSASGSSGTNHRVTLQS